MYELGQRLWYGRGSDEVPATVVAKTVMGGEMLYYVAYGKNTVWTNGPLLRPFEEPPATIAVQLELFP